MNIDCPSCNEALWCNLCGEPYEMEPDYEAMVEAGRKANIDLVPEECEMLFRAGIGGDDGND